jgi:hypothetical protein
MDSYPSFENLVNVALSGRFVKIYLCVGCKWKWDKIICCAAINDKRTYHFSMINSHLSFGASAAICAMAESSRRFKSLLLQFGPKKMTIDK